MTTTNKQITGLLILMGAIIAADVAAQRLYIGPEDGTVQRWAEQSSFDGSVLFCRGFYGSNRQEPNGSGWWTDYPGADQNFLTRLSELSKVRVRFDLETRIPFFLVIPLSDPLIHKCPVLFLEDAGTIELRDEEIKNLHSYLSKGGFVWADDFWGEAAWDQFDYEIRRVLPSGKYSWLDIPKDHPIFHQLYDIKEGIWQQSAIGIWMGTAPINYDDDNEVYPVKGTTSERGAESATPHFRGLQDDHGRLVLVASHNTDIADGWEEEKPENQEYINAFSAKSYALGINIVIYALTH